MIHSESIAKIAEALTKAQAEMGVALKDAVNPFFKSRYADLASIREAIRAPFAKNGLSYAQSAEGSGKDGVLVHTLLMHVSGEWLRGSCWLPATQQSPQSYGSAITYARRYSLAALVGVVADADDDGQRASAPEASHVFTVKEQIRAQLTGAPGPSTQTWETKIKNAASLEALKALLPDLQALPTEQAVALKPLFNARRAELMDSAVVATGPVTANG